MAMIERVARAICKSRTCEGASCCEWPAQGGRKHDCPVSRGAYDDAARAAIEAMREPTEAMTEAMLAANNYELVSISVDAQKQFDMAFKWNAGIDAALTGET